MTVGNKIFDPATRKNRHRLRMTFAAISCALIGLSACGEYRAQGGGETSRWVHKGVKVIRDMAAEIPPAGAAGNPAATFTVLPCNLTGTDLNAATKAISILNTQVLPADTLESAAACSPGDFIRINDAANGPAWIFKTTQNSRDLFYIEDATAILGADVDYYPK